MTVARGGRPAPAHANESNLSKRENPMSDEREDTTIYQVVVNGEEQYSIWPADRELPEGWTAAGARGLKPVCLEWIEQNWTDMRPRSLRQAMAGQA
jgi:MbtH protein